MKLSITLPDELGADIREAARERGVSVSEYVTELVKAEQRRQNLAAWSAEVLAENPPSEEDLAEVRAFIESARRQLLVEQVAR